MVASSHRRLVISTLSLYALFAPSISRAQDFQVRNGYEATYAMYLGGDAKETKKREGIIVLTDSAIAFYECRWRYCETRRDTLFDAAQLIWRRPLTQIKGVSASTQNRGPSVLGRATFGVLAMDQNKEYFGFTYETETSAEAPVFETMKTVAGALEAKVRFRLKKLGIELPP